MQHRADERSPCVQLGALSGTPKSPRRALGRNTPQEAMAKKSPTPQIVLYLRLEAAHPPSAGSWGCFWAEEFKKASVSETGNAVVPALQWDHPSSCEVIMVTAEQLERSLETLDGFKRISKPFLFFFGGPKSSYAIWSGATVKRVVPNHLLAEYSHEDSRYQIMAFNIHGDLDEEALASLRNRAANIPLETVRYESTMQSGARELVAFDFDDEPGEIIAMGDPAAGIFVYPRPVSGKGAQFPLVLYALSGGKHYYLPVAAGLLK